MAPFLHSSIFSLSSSSFSVSRELSDLSRNFCQVLSASQIFPSLFSWVSTTCFSASSGLYLSRRHPSLIFSTFLVPLPLISFSLLLAHSFILPFFSPDGQSNYNTPRKAREKGPVGEEQGQHSGRHANLKLQEEENQLKGSKKSPFFFPLSLSSSLLSPLPSSPFQFKDESTCPGTSSGFTKGQTIWRASLVAQLIRNPPAMRETRVRSL